MVAFFMIVDGIEGYQIILVLIAVLVYVLYELITTKKIKNVVKSLPLLAIPVLVTILMVSGIFITRNVIHNDKFDAEDIAGFAFIEQYSRTYEHFNTEDVFVSSEEAAEIIAESLEKTIEGSYNYEAITSFVGERTVFENVLIKLKSGRVVARDIHIPEKDYATLEQILITSPEYSLKFIEIPHPKEVVSVTAYGYYNTEKNESEELYECFYEEFNKLSYQDKMAVKYPRGEFSSVVQIGVNGYIDNRSFHSSYHIIYEYMPHTATKYLELMTDGYSYGYNDELTYNAREIKYYIDQAEKGNVEYVYGNVTLSKIVGSFDDGSIDKIYKNDKTDVIKVMSEVFDVILSDKNAFVFDDADKIYRLTYNLDLSLIEDSKVFAYDTEPYAVKESYGPTESVVVYETSEHSPYFYISQEIYVSISDEKLAVIEGILDGLYNKDTEKAPSKETAE